MRLVVLVVVAVLAFPVQAGDYTPVMARVSTKHYKIVNGEKRLFWEVTGVYYRARNGSVYQRMIEVFGPSGGQKDETTVYDATAGAVYKLDPQTRKAIFFSPSRALPPSTKPPSQGVVGEEKLNGFDCIVARKVLGTGQRSQTWTYWRARQLNWLTIQVKLEREGYEMVQVFEDIQAGLEADLSFFTVPKDYTVKNESGH